MHIQRWKNGGRALAFIDEYWDEDQSQPLIWEFVDKTISTKLDLIKEEDNSINESFCITLPVYKIFTRFWEGIIVFNWLQEL